LILLAEKKDIHTIHAPSRIENWWFSAHESNWKYGRCVMSYADPTHWRGRAEEMRALAEQKGESVSKQMMLRIAEDYERLARIAEQRAKDSPPRPVFKREAVPAAVRPFARRKNPFFISPPRIPGFEIPRFLKRGPATAEEVGAPVDAGAQLPMRIESEYELAPAEPRTKPAAVE